jgi:carboxypeptidase Taq
MAMLSSSLQQLDAHYRKLESLGHALSMLGVDEAVNMPEGGGAKRAEAMAALSSMYHEMASSAALGEMLEKAEPSSEEEAAALVESKRSFLNRTCLSPEFVARQTEANLRSEQAWRKLRPSGDWAAFAPILENVVGIAREEAAMRADVLKIAPYDAMIEQYDPGSRMATITPVFKELKTELARIIPQATKAQAIRRSQRPKRELPGPFPIEKQKALGEDLMRAIGFDFEHGRLDVSHHPFCGGVPTDVRMTTRYRTDEFISSLLGILHETGHGLYEQGLPPDWQHWPVGQARGMALHESQSLFVEKQLTLHPVFWDYALVAAKKHLAPALADWSVDDVLAHLHRVEPGYIRVDADEVTYPLHVILRYELEQELIGGDMRVRDIPEAWDAKMRAYLGLSSIDNMKDGPMQDVHWSSGAFGYFPSYTLGALLAAQQWEAIKRRHPDVEGSVRRGDFSIINEWRSKNIWLRGSFLPTPELIENATGSPLSAQSFLRHIKQRYLD